MKKTRVKKSRDTVPLNYVRQKIKALLSNVVDPHHIDADPDAYPYSTYHPDADPDADSDFYVMRIRMRILIRIFI